MFIPNSHFFTDPQTISQTAAQVFGGGDENSFAVTARFGSTGGMAYALCKSVVFIQPQAGNDQLVNIVLRPYQQPITGLNIRYIVYRGLRKADFFRGDQVLPAESVPTDFIRKVNKSFDDFYTRTKNTKPDFLAKFIGYDPVNQQAIEAIDDYFFKVTRIETQNGSEAESEKEAFELPMVQAGDSLGFFQSGECGVDIVLGYGDYKLENPIDEFVFDLTYARKPHVEITFPDEATTAQKKRIREQASQFIDAAAFYGFHAENGSVGKNENGSRDKLTGTAIYDQLVSRFYSKNRLYLYIQSDRGRSYNFYENYSSGMDPNIKIDGAALRFGTNGWPVQIIESTQQHDRSETITKLQLITDSNPGAMLYVQVGELTNATKNNFMDAKGLTVSIDADTVTSTAFTPELLLSNPVTGTTNKQLIATFNVLVYEGYVMKYAIKRMGVAEESNYSKERFNDLFDLITGVSILRPVGNEQFVIASQRLKNLQYNNDMEGIAIVQTHKTHYVLDKEPEQAVQICYATDVIDQMVNATNYTNSISPVINAGTSTAGFTGTSENKSILSKYPSTIQQFSDGLEVVRGLLVSGANNGGRLILGLTNGENERIKDLVLTLGLLNARLFFVPFSLENNQLVSSENLRYQKFQLGVIAEDNSNNLNIHLPDQEVVIYSLDSSYFFSRDFSQILEEQIKTGEATINLTL